MSGETFFFYGTLCHRPLLHAVAGRDLHAAPARLPGHRVDRAADAALPALRPEAGAAAAGLLVRDVGAEAAARLDFYATGLGYRAESRRVETADGPVTARVYLDGAPHRAGQPWSLADWATHWGETAVAAAEEVMALRGTRPGAEIFGRYPLILVRASSRVRARAQTPPTEVRRKAVPGDVEVLDWRQPYGAFFALEEADLRFRRFDGSLGDPVRRAVFVSGDAATVLPYDPVRDRVLLIEQFRAGPWGRGDPQPWQLEAIAGRVDPGETPEDCVRREAVEEAGLTLGEVIPLAGYYPSPGAKTEYAYSFLALADLPDTLAGGLGGIADEHEDIRTHLLSFDALMRLVETGEADNGQLILSALFLAARRPGLRRSA